MSTPGSGRYTSFVPIASDRNKLLSKLFNANSPQGAIYGDAYQTDPKKAAEVAVATAVGKVGADGVGGVLPSDGKQAGDLNMFPTGVDLNFGNAPDLADVKWKNAGDPANSFVPDLSSPGAGKTSPTDKDKNPGIEVADVKGAKYVPGAPGTGTASPSVTSPTVSSPIGKNLVMGKSAV